MLRSFLACIMGIFLFANTASAYLGIPEEFSVNQRWLSFTTGFDIECSQYKLGTVHRKLFSLALEYDFYNIHEMLQAKARMRSFNLGAIFDVTDADDVPIGVVEENVFSFFPSFTILAADGAVLAKATRNFWGTKYTITGPSYEAPIATLSRSFFRLKDNWKVNILNLEPFHGKIDNRLFIVVMAFQTDLDYWKNLEKPTHFVGFYKMAGNDAGEEDDIVDFDRQSEFVLRELQAYESCIADIEPSDEDIEFVEGLPELFLTDLDVGRREDTLHYSLEGCKRLMKLLDEDTLTAAQKSALFSMIRSHVKENSIY